MTWVRHPRVTQAQPDVEESVSFGQNGRVALRILGPLEVRDQSGREVRSVLTQPKRLALLSYLALTGRDQYRQRDTVVALLWPESEQARARGALRQALSWLRHELGNPVLVTRGEEEIGVATRGLWCDALAFDEAIAAQDHEQALLLYRGHLLEGVFITGAAAEFEHWLDAERARRHQQATRSAIALAAREASAGRITAAVDWANRAGFLSPNDEDVHRRRLRLLAAAGDRAGALALHTRFAKRLAAEFGTKPSAETEGVAAEVRASNDASLTLPTSGPPAAEPGVANAAAPISGAKARHRSSTAMIGVALALIGTVGTALVWWRISEQPVAIANETTPRARGRPPGDLPPSRASNPRAYDLLLRAAFYQEKRTQEGFRQAVDLANQAIEIDPLYADAWAVLAAAYQGYAWYGVTPAHEAFLKSETAALKAVAFDSTSALGHAMLGAALSFYRFRWADGDVQFRRALTLDSANAQIRNFYGIHLRSLGRFDEALEQLRRAQDLDQLYRHYYYGAGFIQECAGQHASAANEYTRALLYDSAYANARWGLAKALARRGRFDDAILELRRAFIIAADTEKAAVRPATGGQDGYLELRRRAAAIDLRRLRQRAAAGRVVAPTQIAEALLETGDRSGAIDELERAYAVHDPRLFYLICPDYAEVRDDPRIHAIRRRMNLEPITPSR